MAVAPKPPLTRRLDLPAHVQRLRSFLLDVARFGEDEGKWENLEVRFAGGWVRDMLLQWPSDDIDVALSSVTGVSFVATLQAYLETEQCLNEHGLSKSDVGRMYKVDANVAKSKHLETATLPILGVDLDFVNLRKEVYNHDSRTPVMQFGTAREDAVRRDATINALFYNLHTEEVEDFTTGLADLDSGLIRTPMDPYQTFMDDPLRILRLVRFASRYNFPIVDNVKACMGRREVLDAFMAKISRERVGIELLKMFKATSPRRSLVLFDDINLYSTIFNPMVGANPNQEEREIQNITATLNTSGWSTSYDCLQAILDNKDPKTLCDYLVQGGDGDRPICWLLACLSPLMELSSPQILTGEKQPLCYAGRVAKHGIKQPGKIVDLVNGGVRHLKEIKELRDLVLTGDLLASQQDVLGMAIKRWDAGGGRWKLQVLSAILAEASQLGISKATTLNSDAPLRELLQGWTLFLEHIEDCGLMDAATRKPLIDGSQLTKALRSSDMKSPNPGPWMKDAMDYCMAWQFRHPECSDTTEAIEQSGIVEWCQRYL